MPKRSSSLPAHRRAMMLELIGRTGSVAVPELARQFAVSVDTVRRDLDHLAGSGALIRAHGGALRAEQGDRLTPFADRVATQAEEKAAIAKACAKLVRNGETVMINGGSTTLHVADALQQHADTVMFTNSIAIVESIPASRFASIHALGGEYIASTRVTIGPLMFANSDRINIDTAIIGVRALNAQKGICTGKIAEASMIAEMIALARRTIVVAGSAKFDVQAFATIAPLSAIDILVTDARPPTELGQILTSAGVELVIA